MIRRLTLRAIILAVVGLTFIGTGTVRLAGAASEPLDLLIFYGWPSVINQAAGPAAAAAEYARYDFVVLGAGPEVATHPDHNRTAALLAEPALQGTFVFGYVTLGLASVNLSLEEVRSHIEAWQAIGADGIFFDEFGYDFGVTRERQNAAVDYAHSLGMPVMANAWEPADVFGREAGPPNPEGRAPSLGAGDYYLSESYFVMDGRYTAEAPRLAKASRLAAYQAALGFSVMSIATAGPAGYDEEMFFAAWRGAAADGHVATGWGEYLFSVDGRAPYRTRPSQGPAESTGTTLPPNRPSEPVTTTTTTTTTTTMPTPQAPAASSVTQVDREEGNEPPAQPFARATCAGQRATIVGTPGDDVLIGTTGADVIAGLGGDDTILAGAGDDLVCGGGGSDILSGGPGNDRLGGGRGSDWLSGDEGDDFLRGGHEADHLDGGAGADRIVGGPGADVIIGKQGDDMLFGKEGQDLLVGEAGFDRARGGPLSDGCQAERTFDCEG